MINEQRLEILNNKIVIISYRVRTYGLGQTDDSDILNYTYSQIRDSLVIFIARGVFLGPKMPHSSCSIQLDWMAWLDVEP